MGKECVAAKKAVRDSILLMRLEGNRIRHARKSQVRAVILTQTHAVEPTVIVVLDLLHADGIGEQPRTELVTQFLLLHLRLRRQLRIDDRLIRALCQRDTHLRIALIEAELDQFVRLLRPCCVLRLRGQFVGKTLRLRDLPGACLLHVVNAHLGKTERMNELLHIRGLQPRRTETDTDVADLHTRRENGLECRSVAFHPRNAGVEDRRLLITLRRAALLHGKRLLILLFQCRELRRLSLLMTSCKILLGSIHQMQHGQPLHGIAQLLQKHDLASTGLLRPIELIGESRPGKLLILPA